MLPQPSLASYSPVLPRPGGPAQQHEVRPELRRREADRVAAHGLRGVRERHERGRRRGSAWPRTPR